MDDASFEKMAFEKLLDSMKRRMTEWAMIDEP